MAYTKQTIAIIGIKNIFGAAFARKLCEGNFRIVMFDENLAEARSVQESICKNNRNADVDIVDCKYMASWEADIIIIAMEDQELNNAAKKIVNVSTQKIVAILSDVGTYEKLNEFEKMFPHSKVSILIPNEEGVALYSRDERSLETLQKMIRESGYETTINTSV